jgi:hypothetical protein
MAGSSACAAEFTAFTGSARAAEEVDVFPAAGVTLTADALRAEETSLASVTFLVGALERVSIALFPPVVPSVVFAIASPFRLC